MARSSAGSAPERVPVLPIATRWLRNVRHLGVIGHVTVAIHPLMGTSGSSYPCVMELEFRHLRIVCAIADAGSVTRASTQLGLSPPALTHPLQRIASLLGGR